MSGLSLLPFAGVFPHNTVLRKHYANAIMSNYELSFHTTLFYGNEDEEEKERILDELATFHTTLFYGNAATKNITPKIMKSFPHNTVLRKRLTRW